MENRDELKAFIEHRMAELGYNQRSLALKAGCKEDAVRNFLRGVSKNLRSDIYGKIMRALRNNKSTVVGEVGAGQAVQSFDNDGSLEEVERPLGDDLPLDIVAVRVKGDSMEPQLEDGWLLFYSRHSDGVPPECIGELCVVKLKNEGTLVKKVRQGSKPGLYHLLSKNPAHEPLLDQKLMWASRVLDIRPK